MTTDINTTADREAITALLNQYFKGARSGRSDDLKSAFHVDATIFGYVGEDLFAGPIADFYDWHDNNGPATELEASIDDINIQHSIATAQVELHNWTGHHFTDLFTLLKIDGEWKIMNKVFHLHD